MAEVYSVSVPGPASSDEEDNSSESPVVCKAVEGCTIPVDILLESSDGVVFGAHTKNLEYFTDGFPRSDTTTQSDAPETVSLTEKGDTLLLFLALTHNHPAPDLSSLDIDKLIDLAETADKYGNYFALTACRQPMRALADKSATDALKALRFKAIHNDLEGIDAIAQKTVVWPAVYVLQNTFGGNYLREFAIWFQYQASYESMKATYHATLGQQPPMDPNARCGHCQTTRNVVAILRPIAERDFCSLDAFNKVVEHRPQNPCYSCQAFNNWCATVRASLQKPPSWTDFTI